MKILTSKEFMKLPENTLFCKYATLCFQFIGIKGETLGDPGIDFFYYELFDVDCDGSIECHDLEDKIDSGDINQVSLTYSTGSRDGCFEDDQKYCVFENHEVKNLIERLGKCVKDI